MGLLRFLAALPIKCAETGEVRIRNSTINTHFAVIGPVLKFIAVAIDKNVIPKVEAFVEA